MKDYTDLICSIILGTVIVLVSAIMEPDPDKQAQSNVVTNNFRIGRLGEGWHYAIRHNTGDEMEDDKGCPCVTIASGYSSYCNLTNAISHGKGRKENEVKE